MVYPEHRSAPEVAYGLATRREPTLEGPQIRDQASVDRSAAENNETWTGPIGVWQSFHRRVFSKGAKPSSANSHGETVYG
jgi:hypothetical protein